MKMKLFGTKIMNKQEPDASRLEAEVNLWLEENPDIEVVKIKQSSNGGSFNSTKVYLSIWYEERA